MNPKEDTTQLNSSVAQLNTALAGLNKARGTSFKPITPVNATIQADKLGKAQPYNVPPVNNASTTGNLAQTTNQYVAQATTNATAPEPTTPVNQNKSKLNSYLEGIMGNISGQADAVNAINKEEDVANKKAQALTLSNELDVFDKEYRDEIKAIKENPQGKFGGAIQQDIDKAEERYQDVRANKVLSYNSALNDYQGASEIATSKIQALKDQNSQALQAYSLFADSVMNDLTESEKLQVEANIQQKQLQAKTVEDAYSQALSAGLDNGAGQSYFNALDTAKRTGNVASILGTVSQYGYQTLDQQVQRSSLALDNAQLAKLNQDIATARNELVATTGITPEQAERKIEVVTLANELAKSDATGKKSAVGASLAKFLPFGQSLGLQGNRTAFESKVNTLKSNLTLDNLKLLKGAMSDKDLMFLNSIGSSLDVNMSEAQFDKELGRVITKLDPDKTITNALNPTSTSSVIKTKKGTSLDLSTFER